MEGGTRGFEQVDDVVVLLLDADPACAGTDQLHGERRPSITSLGVGAQDFLVLVQQGLALGGVDEHGVGLAGELDVGGEARAAGADDSGLGDGVGGDGLGHGLPFRNRGSGGMGPASGEAWWPFSIVELKRERSGGEA